MSNFYIFNGGSHKLSFLVFVFNLFFKEENLMFIPTYSCFTRIIGVDEKIHLYLILMKIFEVL